MRAYVRRALSAAAFLSTLALFACGGDGTNQVDDLTPPSAPTGLGASAASSSQVNLSWNPSSDDVGVVGYVVYRNSGYLKEVGGTSASDTGLAAATQYCYRVSAYDAAGNESIQSSQACATTSSGGSGDVTAPSVPSGLSATPVSSSVVDLSWSASTDNVGVTGYRVYRGATFLKEVAGTSTSDTGLAAATQYCYRVSARDAATNESAQSSQACATTQSGATAPAVPTNVQATNVAQTTATISWTDNSSNETGFQLGTCGGLVSVGGNGALNCASGFTQFGQVGANVTSSNLSGLTAGTLYQVFVRAYNAAGTSANLGVGFTTQAAAICTAGATRCVAGAAGDVETCNASGAAWVRSACGYFKLCSRSACRTVCGVTATLTYPTACFVPNADGVNNGTLYYTSNTSLLAVPTQANGGAAGNSSGGAASVYLDTGSTWPYYWNFSSQGYAFTEFKLNQFSNPRTVSMGYRAKRSGIINDNLNHILMVAFNPSTDIAQCSPQASYLWDSEYCTVGAPYNAGFNYSGSWNSFLMQPTGDGFGGTIDLLDVNYVWLEVRP
jgi:chitodextrinase